MGNKTKLQTLMDIEGFSDLNKFIEEECMGFGMRVGVPSICMNPDCDYSTDMEPDQDRGWCDECQDNTVMSALILAGIL